MKLPRTAKRLAERALSMAFGNPRRMSTRTLILAYHNVVPHGTPAIGEHSLHLPLGSFLRQLDLLEQHCHVASLKAVLGGQRHQTKPTVAITFDDAYRGAVELGVPALVNRGLPSTMFVAPGLLGTRSFWWDELAGEGDGLSEPLRAQALGEHGGRAERVRACAPRSAASVELPPSYACASADQVVRLGALSGVELGSHSWGHPNLVRCSGDELTEELTRPLRWLATTGLATLPVLAYPYGLRSPSVTAAVKRAGYSAALLVDGGWLPTGALDRFSISRFNVPAGLSESGFLLRLSGVLGD